MKPRLGIPVTLFLVAAANAQDKVIPVSLTSTEGNNYSVYHFGYQFPKSQQIWTNTAITKGIAVITGLQYRRDTGHQKVAYPARSYKSATFSLGTTSVSPATMSTTFATNVTSALTVVLNAKAWSLPALAAPPASPAPFNIGINWTTPFVYDAAKGNLILQVELPGPAAKSSYFCDAERTAKSGGGTIQRLGTGGAFWRREVYALSGNPAALTPGGSLDLQCGKFSKGYAGSLIIGLSNTRWSGITLPMDLSMIGAPKNNLYVSLDTQLPFPATGSGTNYNSSFRAPIPSSPIYSGLTFYTQAWYADANANNAGLVASNALTLTIAKSGGPIAQTVGHFSTSNPTGNYIYGTNNTGGPVIKFLGIIP